MRKELSKIRKFSFDDNTYVIFEEYRTIGGRYLFSDVYYKDIKDSSYLGQYNELDEPNIWVRKNGEYIIIYEYEITNTNETKDNQLVKNIINLYDIDDDMDVFGKYDKLLEIFNKGKELLKLKKGYENKKVKSENRRKHYTSRKDKIYQNVTEYEIIDEEKLNNVYDVDRKDYKNPVKGVYNFIKTYKKK